MTRLMKGTGRLLVLLGFCLIIVAVSTLMVFPMLLVILGGYSPWILTAYTPFILPLAYMVGDDT